MYQEYTVICIFDQMHVNLIWYLYPFMLNKICLSLSLSLIASLITGLTIVYSTVYSDADQRNRYFFIKETYDSGSYDIDLQVMMPISLMTQPTMC